jgi:hypothetical protein
MNPRVITFLKTVSVLGAICVAAPVRADAGTPPTWRLEGHHKEADPKDYLVQIGVRVVQRSDSCLYVYTVVNRSSDTLTSIQIGYDSSTEQCELTGAPPHAPPDTAYSPGGWECSPAQMKHSRKTFAVVWKIVRGLEETGGIPPTTTISGFTVVLPKIDPLYEQCHFRTPFKSLPFMSAIGRLMPEADLESGGRRDAPRLENIPISATGKILGKVTDQRGEGVPYANVIIKGTQLGGRGSAEGSYFITKVPVGKYRVATRAMGYAPSERSVEVSADQTTVVNFTVSEVRVRIIAGPTLVRDPVPEATAADIPPAVAALSDTTQMANWHNIAGYLGFLGFPECFGPLHNFIWSRFRGEVGPATSAIYTAQANMGPVAASSPEALRYLIQATAPEFWKSLPWRDPRRTDPELRLAMSEASIYALGMSGTPEAGQMLARLRQWPYRDAQRTSIESAIRTHWLVVRAGGARQYVRKRWGPLAHWRVPASK